MEMIWADTFVEEGTITQHIRNLRPKLGKTPEGESYIKHMGGRGYYLSVPVTLAGENAAETTLQKWKLSADHYK